MQEGRKNASSIRSGNLAHRDGFVNRDDAHQETAQSFVQDRVYGLVYRSLCVVCVRHVPQEYGHGHIFRQRDDSHPRVEDNKRLARVVGEAVKNIHPIVWLVLIGGVLGSAWFMSNLFGGLFGVIPLLLSMVASLAFWALAVWIAAVVWKATTRK
jgi:hypothetical protein